MSGLSEQEIRELVDSVPHWHHVMRLGPVITPGVYDPSGLLPRLKLPEDLGGKRVLDVGTRDGYFAFECERRGAEVVAIDHANPEATGFPAAQRIMNSSVEYVQVNVYDVTPERFGQFDLVLFLGILYHLRHPLLALDRMRSLCRGCIAVESLVCDEHFFTGYERTVRLASLSRKLVRLPIAQFLERGRFHPDGTNKWVPNLALLEALLRESAFSPLEAQTWGERALVRAEAVEDPEAVYFVELDRGLRTAP